VWALPITVSAKVVPFPLVRMLADHPSVLVLVASCPMESLPVVYPLVPISAVSFREMSPTADLRVVLPLAAAYSVVPDPPGHPPDVL